MQKYLLTTCLFALGYLGLSTLIMYNGWHTYVLPNKDIYEAIRRSQSEQEATQLLIIGDSVAKQIFDPRNGVDSITSLACNQSIDLVGHYLLLKDFLVRNPHVERIVFIYNPFSFSNDLDHKYTYNYFLKPFYKRHYRSAFTGHVKERIAEIPYAGLVNFPPVATTFWMPDYEFKAKPDYFLSTTSFEYLKKIEDLADQKGIPLALLSAPIRQSRMEEVRRLEEQYKNSGRQLKLLETYFDKITYVPDTLFLDDIHFERPEEMMPIVEAQLKVRFGQIKEIK